MIIQETIIISNLTPTSLKDYTYHLSMNVEKGEGERFNFRGDIVNKLFGRGIAPSSPPIVALAARGQGQSH